ncbi:odorant receptor 4-like [Phlebotomus argentipes]|uniref:odorant receptor 4-like n=1 Tax=Phlebotomus argentipes TaxID=94469 RepID=UPI0028933CFC|nr:odorant receptor 4-like [Phlebotomus argentipes]
MAINIVNKDKVQNIVKYFDCILNTEQYIISNLRNTFYSATLRQTFIYGRLLWIFITSFGLAVAVFDVTHTERHMPLLHSTPGISEHSVFYYPVNIVLQLAFDIITLEFVVCSDLLIIVMIMYCNAEIKSILALISSLNNEDIVGSEANVILKIIHNVHVSFFENANQLTDVFWQIYFHKLFTILIYFCSAMFLLQSKDVSILASLLCLVVIVVQSFLLCYFGQVLQNGSEEMANSLYMTKWYLLAIKDQKILLILMNGFKNPIKVETFGFGVISYYTFVQICKASTSYAAIIYTLYL